MSTGKKVVFLFIILLYSFFIQAQSYQVGSIVKDFKLPDVTSKIVSLSDYPDAKGFIVVFTCNTCPFSKLYDDRLLLLHSKYQNLGFPLLTINANDAGKQPDDSFENMKVKAKERNFSFPYLYDEDQRITALFNPVKTPHAFVINKENNNYRIVYSGAIDDSASNADAVKTKFVENAVDEILQGKKVVASSIKPIGCTVKWKKLNY